MKHRKKKEVKKDSQLGLRCPECGEKTEVRETRAAASAIIRRRICPRCGHRKTARETWI